MTKAEYLDMLKKNLRNRINAKELRDVLSHYNEFFEAAIDEGQSENEICLSLGNPDKLAEAIIDDGSPKSEDSLFEKISARIVAGLLLAFCIALLLWSWAVAGRSIELILVQCVLVTASFLPSALVFSGKRILREKHTLRFMPLWWLAIALIAFLMVGHFRSIFLRNSAGEAYGLYMEQWFVIIAYGEFILYRLSFLAACIFLLIGIKYDNIWLFWVAPVVGLCSWFYVIRDLLHAIAIGGNAIIALLTGLLLFVSIVLTTMFVNWKLKRYLISQNMPIGGDTRG